MNSPTMDQSFPHQWKAEILTSRPQILPARNFVYPAQVEEVERGALEILVRPGDPGGSAFLATCALGFRDAIVPTGVWSMPDPEALCAVSGGYAYVIDTTAPERFTMLTYRPVLQVLPATEAGLLLFVGHRSILAWGQEGQAWESPKVSDEGVTVSRIEGLRLDGLGWKMMTDKETPYALDLRTGALISK